MVSSSEFDLLSHFGTMDELIQLIYQGTSKFVVLSAVDSAHWTVHLGLATHQGRWWKGKWAEKDITRFLNTSSPRTIEKFADGVAHMFTSGDMFVRNWSAGGSADIDLTIGPAAKTPIHIPLTELDAAEAALYAAKMFAEIASQAQKTRHCRLHPSTDPVSQQVPSVSQAVMPPPPTNKKVTASSSSSVKDGKVPAAAKALQHEPTVAEIQANQKIKDLEAKLAVAQAEVKRKSTVLEPMRSESLLASRAKTAAPAVKPIKGASLANPNKKARKYQALEFEDD